MSEFAADLDRLEELLWALPEEAEAMLISQLDGFLAGLLILPEPVSDLEWLPHIWNHYPLEGEDLPIAEEIGRLARLRKAEIALNFRQGGGTYEPIFDLDTDGSFFWEVWFEGYEQAVVLQENIYDTLNDEGDEQMRKAIFGMVWVALAAHDKLEELGSPMDQRELHQLVPVILPRLVENLFRCSHGLPLENPGFEIPVGAGPRPSVTSKVGRNAPCPCGSGKKYKKCCGFAQN
jgi:uncharacterized protein